MLLFITTKAGEYYDVNSSNIHTVYFIVLFYSIQTRLEITMWIHLVIIQSYSTVHYHQDWRLP